MGQWLQKYGESIYGTRGGPFKGNSLCSSTHKGNRIYLHVFGWFDDRVTLPAISRRILRSWLLTRGKIEVNQSEDAVTVTVAKEYQQDVVTVAVLELDGPAGTIEPVAVPSSSLAYQAQARASSVYGDRASSQPDKAFDDDYRTCWRSKGNQGWLQVDLGAPRLIEAALIWDGGDYFGTEEYELLGRVGQSWQSLAKGTTLAQPAQVRFEPVTAQEFRLNVSRKERQVMIYEFQLFGPQSK
jgi:alpha-L-fucosidase